MQNQAINNKNILRPAGEWANTRRVLAVVLLGLAACTTTTPDPVTRLPEKLQFTAPRIESWSDIGFMIGDKRWQVDSESVRVLVRSSNYGSRVWDAELKGPDGQTARIKCTSNTVFPASGGSYFEANCTLPRP